MDEVVNPNGNLRVESVRTFDGLDKYADSWNLLALNFPHQHPVLTHSWISAYLKTSLAGGETWFCLFAFDKNELVGVLPLLTSEIGFLRGRYLSLQTPVHPHTMAVDFLFREEYGKRVIRLFAGYLNDLRPRVIRFKMNQVAYNSPSLDILKEGIDQIYTSYYPYSHVSIIPVEGTFNEYKKGLSKKFVSNLRRSRNKLEKLGDLSVTVIDEGGDARENLLSFAAVEQSGWKGRKGTAVKYMFWRFYEELVDNMGKREWLQWYFLNSGNKRIAGYLTIPFGRSVFIFKTGYDEEYHACSPGSLLTEKMLEHIFSTGKYDVVNFFTDYEWLSRWKVEQKPYYNVLISFNNPLSLVLARVPSAIFARSQLVRRLKALVIRRH